MISKNLNRAELESPKKAMNFCLIQRQSFTFKARYYAVGEGIIFVSIVLVKHSRSSKSSLPPPVSSNIAVNFRSKRTIN